MTENKRMGIGILLTLLLVGGAFFVEQLAKVQGNASGLMVAVMQDNKTVAYVDAGVIEQLSIQEKEENLGNIYLNSEKEVSLRYVLDSAGIISYSAVEVNGIGKSETYRLKNIEEIEDIALVANENKTMAIVNKKEGNNVIFKSIRTISILNR